MKNSTWYLGIDGGGTKTEAVLGTDLKHLHWAKAGPSNPHAVGLKTAVKNLEAVVKSVKKSAGFYGKCKAAVGLAGLDSSRDFKIIKGAISRSLKKSFQPDWRLLNDIQIALASGTMEKSAAVIIAGTGSNAYAKGPLGVAKAGGRGHLLADEGSGYYQGLMALHAITKANDGRGPKTLLTPLILKYFKIKFSDQLLKIVYQPGFGKPQIASLAPLVQTAAEKGDKVAKIILAEAAKELALMVIAVIKKSGLNRKKFNLVCVGGIFKCPIVLPDIFGKSVKAAAPGVKFVLPEKRPAFGAWLLAAKLKQGIG